MAQIMTEYVTKRYKITKEMDNKLLEIERELNIPPSAMVRLALDVVLPKLKKENFTYEGMKTLWGKQKF